MAYGRVFAVSVTGATLAAYDAVDGRRVWTSPTQGAGAPTVANGVVYVVGPTGVQAYDPSTGALLATIAGQFSGEAVLAEGSLVVACQTAAVGPGMCVYRP